MSQYEEPSFDPSKFRPFIFIGIGVVILIILLANVFVILEPKERGVVFKKYTSGLDVDNIKGESLNIIATWNELIIFEIAEQQIEETMDVLSRDGLSVILNTEN